MMKRESFLPSLPVTNICLIPTEGWLYLQTEVRSAKLTAWRGVDCGVDHTGRVWKDDGVWYNYDGLIQIALGNSQFPAIIADLSRIDTM